MAGKFIKGALIEFMETFLLPLPNVISFQFNPETMTHAWTQSQSNSNPGRNGEVRSLARRLGRAAQDPTFSPHIDPTDIQFNSPIRHLQQSAYGMCEKLIPNPIGYWVRDNVVII